MEQNQKKWHYMLILDGRLAIKAKKRAIDEGITFNNLVIKALTEYLKKKD